MKGVPAILALAVLLPGCPGKEPPRRGAVPRLETPPPSRPPLVVPEADPPPEAKISFYLDLVALGVADDLAWALGQLRKAGEAAAEPLRARLAARFGRPETEHFVHAFAEAVPPAGAMDLLLRAATVRDERVGLHAARALGRTGKAEALPALFDLLGSGIHPVSDAALEGILAIGGEAAVNGFLGRFPQHMDPDVAARAIQPVSELLPDRTRTAFLRGALASEDPRISLAAARQVFRSLPELRAAARARVDDFLDGDYRGPALEVLAEARDQVALGALCGLSRVEDDGAAIFALGNLSHYEAPEARAALWDAAVSRHDARRREALHALARSGDPGALPRIRGMLSSREVADRLVAALVLGSIRDPGSLPELRAAAEVEPEPNVRVKLANAIALLGATEGSATVVRMLLAERETEPSVAFVANQAASMLLRFPELSPEARGFLGAALRSPNEAIRMNAARAAGRRGLGSDLTALLGRLLTDPSVHVRRSAVGGYVLADGATAEPVALAYRREGDGRLAQEMEVAVRKLVHRWQDP
ncbi:MAG: HEAT repeat domain-containing protein [Planctomycetes bacterium]|nr:HEAT repeat domain-containing protein [Planctomycetota bacterium]